MMAFGCTLCWVRPNDLIDGRGLAPEVYPRLGGVGGGG
jgi:hypothetical protein